jgi:hypothetical protein
MQSELSRREALAAMATAAAAGAAPAPQVDPGILRRHDETVERLLKTQETNPASRWCGTYSDDFGLHHCGSAGGILNNFAAALLHPASKFHNNSLLVDRMRLAAGYLERAQNAEGNIDLITTNFNSPPDTAFVVHGVASAATLTKRYGANELLAMMETFLRKAGGGMAGGGVHTPNHRWVICQALAQVHELFPDPAYPRRIEQWLAEGIDIDVDGQYTERSTLVYNPVTDRALTVVAIKMNKPELLDAVRKNLDAMLYLLHPGYEVVTEISRRQDANQRGDMRRYWFPLRWLAVKDGNGQYAGVARSFAPKFASLADLMEYPELSLPGPESAPVPDNYEKEFPAVGIARIRRGPTSATLTLGGSSRFFTLRRGEAVINAVRFASAFFGKGQFVPTWAGKRGGSYQFTQSLDAGYYQPFEPPRKVAADYREWANTREGRRRTEICRLDQSATVTETQRGFEVRMQVQGTDGVPVAVEVNLRDDGKLEGCEPAPRARDTWLLASGYALYRVGRDAIRFGPGAAPNRYTQVRGSQPKLPGPSVYITGYSPFDHTLVFEWA